MRQQPHRVLSHFQGLSQVSLAILSLAHVLSRALTQSLSMVFSTSMMRYVIMVFHELKEGAKEQVRI